MISTLPRLLPPDNWWRLLPAIDTESVAIKSQTDNWHRSVAQCVCCLGLPLIRNYRDAAEFGWRVSQQTTEGTIKFLWAGDLITWMLHLSMRTRPIVDQPWPTQNPCYSYPVLQWEVNLFPVAHFSLLLHSATCSFPAMEGELTHIQGFLQLSDNVRML